MTRTTLRQPVSPFDCALIRDALDREKMLEFDMLLMAGEAGNEEWQGWTNEARAMMFAWCLEDDTQTRLERLLLLLWQELLQFPVDSVISSSLLYEGVALPSLPSSFAGLQTVYDFARMAHLGLDSMLDYLDEHIDCGFAERHEAAMAELQDLKPLKQLEIALTLVNKAVALHRVSSVAPATTMPAGQPDHDHEATNDLRPRA